MILINLLPHREIARKRKKETFTAQALLAAILGGVVAAVGYMGINILIMNQEGINQRIETRTAKYKPEIANLKEAEAKLAALQAKRTAVENLQEDRNMVVRWMSDLARLTPDGVYLTKISQDGLELSVEGVALDTDDISAFIASAAKGKRQTITNSTWTGTIEKVPLKLQEDQPAQVVNKFDQLRFQLVRNVEEVTSKEE